jgi:hypothetical protein
MSLAVSPETVIPLKSVERMVVACEAPAATQKRRPAANDYEGMRGISILKFFNVQEHNARQKNIPGCYWV